MCLIKRETRETDRSISYFKTTCRDRHDNIGIDKPLSFPNKKWSYGIDEFPKIQNFNKTTIVYTGVRVRYRRRRSSTHCCTPRGRKLFYLLHREI